MSNDTFNELEFERDFCIALNMMLGQSYDEASVSARGWMNDARDDQEEPMDLTKLTPRQRQLRSSIRGFLLTATQEEIEKNCIHIFRDIYEDDIIIKSKCIRC